MYDNHTNNSKTLSPRYQTRLYTIFIVKCFMEINDTVVVWRTQDSLLSTTGCHNTRL